jgi:hypothetical protein
MRGQGTDYTTPQRQPSLRSHLQRISLRVRRIVRSADRRTKFPGNQITDMRKVRRNKLYGLHSAVAEFRRGQVPGSSNLG